MDSRGKGELPEGGGVGVTQGAALPTPQQHIERHATHHRAMRHWRERAVDPSSWTNSLPGARNVCYRRRNAWAPGTAVVMSSCDGQPGQAWAVKPDGTIRIHGQCLDYARYGAGRKLSVHLAAYTGTSSQQWSNVITHLTWK